MADHTCRACIVFCMDFRLHDGLAGMLRDEGLDSDRADIIRVAGAAKSLARPAQPRDRQLMLEMLQVSYDLHRARQFYLVNHEDCGAYGPEEIPDSAEELQVHRDDLHAAKDLLSKQFPDVEVIPCFLWLDGRVDRV